MKDSAKRLESAIYEVVTQLETQAREAAQRGDIYAVHYFVSRSFAMQTMSRTTKQRMPSSDADSSY